MNARSGTRRFIVPLSGHKQQKFTQSNRIMVPTIILIRFLRKSTLLDPYSFGEIHACGFLDVSERSVRSIFYPWSTSIPSYTCSETIVCDSLLLFCVISLGDHTVPLPKRKDNSLLTETEPTITQSSQSDNYGIDNSWQSFVSARRIYTSINKHTCGQFLMQDFQENLHI